MPAYVVARCSSAAALALDSPSTSTTGPGDLDLVVLGVTDLEAPPFSDLEIVEVGVFVGVGEVSNCASA
jgi:hypothetical protein